MPRNTGPGGSPQATSAASTLHDVAERSGTSIATVSRALNQPDKLRRETLERVREAMRELQFRPNLIGRQLRGERTSLVGVVLPDMLNPVFGECLQGIEESAAQGAYRVLLTTTGYDSAREEQAIDTLLSQRVDGLILTVARAQDHPLLAQLAADGVPYQLVYNHCDSHPCVSVDNRAAARELVTELVLLGHRRIGMLSGSRAASDRAMQRHQGYCDAMRAAGLAARAPLEIDFHQRRLPTDMLAALRDPRRRPTALFCGNDFLALLVMRELREAGMRVPEDISVVGFDGLSFGELLAPPLATVCQPHRQLGSTAWSHLQHVLEGGAPRSSVLAHRLRIDGTVAPPSSRPRPE